MEGADGSTELWRKRCFFLVPILLVPILLVTILRKNSGRSQVEGGEQLNNSQIVK